MDKQVELTTQTLLPEVSSYLTSDEIVASVPDAALEFVRTHRIGLDEKGFLKLIETEKTFAAEKAVLLMEPVEDESEIERIESGCEKCLHVLNLAAPPDVLIKEDPQKDCKLSLIKPVLRAGLDYSPKENILFSGHGPNTLLYLLLYDYGYQADTIHYCISLMMLRELITEQRTSETMGIAKWALTSVAPLLVAYDNRRILTDLRDRAFYHLHKDGEYAEALEIWRKVVGPDGEIEDLPAFTAHFEAGINEALRAVKISPESQLLVKVQEVTDSISSVCARLRDESDYFMRALRKDDDYKQANGGSSNRTVQHLANRQITYDERIDQFLGDFSRQIQVVETFVDKLEDTLLGELPIQSIDEIRQIITGYYRDLVAEREKFESQIYSPKRDLKILAARLRSYSESLSMYIDKLESIDVVQQDMAWAGQNFELIEGIAGRLHARVYSRKKSLAPLCQKVAEGRKPWDVYGFTVVFEGIDIESNNLGDFIEGLFIRVMRQYEIFGLSDGQRHIAGLNIIENTFKAHRKGNEEYLTVKATIEIEGINTPVELRVTTRDRYQIQRIEHTWYKTFLNSLNRIGVDPRTLIIAAQIAQMPRVERDIELGERDARVDMRRIMVHMNSLFPGFPIFTEEQIGQVYSDDQPAEVIIKLISSFLRARLSYLRVSGPGDILLMDSNGFSSAWIPASESGIRDFSHILFNPIVASRARVHRRHFNAATSLYEDSDSTVLISRSLVHENDLATSSRAIPINELTRISYDFFDGRFYYPVISCDEIACILAGDEPLFIYGTDGRQYDSENAVMIKNLLFITDEELILLRERLQSVRGSLMGSMSEAERSVRKGSELKLKGERFLAQAEVLASRAEELKKEGNEELSKKYLSNARSKQKDGGKFIRSGEELIQENEGIIRRPESKVPRLYIECMEFIKSRAALRSLTRVIIEGDQQQLKEYGRFARNSFLQIVASANINPDHEDVFYSFWSDILTNFIAGSITEDQILCMLDSMNLMPDRKFLYNEKGEIDYLAANYLMMLINLYTIAIPRFIRDNRDMVKGGELNKINWLFAILCQRFDPDWQMQTNRDGLGRSATRAANFWDYCIRCLVNMRTIQSYSTRRSPSHRDVLASFGTVIQRTRAARRSLDDQFPNRPVQQDISYYINSVLGVEFH